MKVILKENVASLGKIGDVIKVSEGYARNFLIPKGLAIEASTKNIKALQHEKKTIENRAAKQKAQAELLRDQLEGMACTVYRKEGEQGKLFGSVTAKDIEKALAENKIDVERKNVVLDEPIKSIGEHQVKIKIYPGITAEIKVVVKSEE